MKKIKIVGAKVHNLKDVSLEIPRDKLIVFTGLSGSGKSSLAFDTIYAEGQRRYMESLSSYARQFLHQLDKPDVDHIEGLSPSISIDQKTASSNPRSTVGTVTEIYDYFRILFSSIGKPHCPKCAKPIQNMSIQEMVNTVMDWPEGIQLLVLSPLIRSEKGTFSSLFEELLKEGYTRVRVNGEVYRLDDVPMLSKNKKHTIELVVDRLKVNPENSSRLFQSMETASKKTQGLVLVESTDRKQSRLFSEHLSCAECELSLEEISPRLFSFNSPLGACSECNGLGDILDFDPELVIEHPDLPIRHCTGKVLNLDRTYYGRSVERAGKRHDFNMSTPFNKLTKSQKNIVLYGSEDAVEDNPFIKGDVEDFKRGWGKWEGILTNLRRRFFQTKSEGMRFYFRGYMSAKPCNSCQGARLKKTALGVTVSGYSIHDFMKDSVANLIQKIESLKFSNQEKKIIKQVHKEIMTRLQFLQNVGLGYLTLSRKAGTLSGGEFQRIRLATQIGAGLTGVLYVLDEPSIGLHQRDNQKLIQALINLKNLGNTLIIVEHDEDTIKAADYVVDIGPGAGRKGGEIVFSGSIAKFLTNKTSLTAQYVQKTKEIEMPSKRRNPKNRGKITIHKAEENNLKKVTVSFPLGKFICVAGVSGSGKSSLIHEVLHKALMRHFHKSKERPGKHQKITGLELIDKMITIDQSPIGRTPRSNPCTYTGVFGPIRDLFAATRESKIRGYKAGRFSFNVKGGRCEACEGDGVKKIEMHFLSDVFVTCDVCKGKRYNRETLEVTYKGNSINDVLKMTVNEASEIFKNIPSIYNKLKTLLDVGLGYVHLGQNAVTLSGGEAQRVKLAKELSKKSTGKTLYLLDEPTTGLHFEDIRQLLTVLNRLVDSGNTIVVIEHNIDVIKTADHIIDVGPEGGELGGNIVAEGSPEQIIKNKASITGKFLPKK